MLQFCPVCNSEKTRQDDDPSWTDQSIKYLLLNCEACGSAHTYPMPSDARLQELYSCSFDYQWYRDHFHGKLQDCKIRINELKDILGKRVLDFGGGIGYFSQAAREAGYESLTYDPFASDTKIPDGKWDTIVALHVLEHANDLDRIFELFKKLLNPDGKLIIAVPNYSGFGYRDLKMQWVWAQPPLIHIFHFTDAGLAALASRHGFSKIKISFHERWDANFYADVLHAESFRKRDAWWGYPVLRSIPGYRKTVAFINTWLRFRSLRKSVNIPEQGRAELLICASY
jgi:SAM-dependent methyltransferase